MQYAWLCPGASLSAQLQAPARYCQASGRCKRNRRFPSAARRATHSRFFPFQSSFGLTTHSSGRAARASSSLTIRRTSFSVIWCDGLHPSCSGASGAV